MDASGSVSLRICLDGHANSFALNKENNCIAVAGRSCRFVLISFGRTHFTFLLSILVLKVFNIDSDGFSEVHNMRQQQSNNKSLNLTFSSNAIAWSHLDTNLLATSATNGAVSIWDINKFGRNKQLNVYHDHERTTHAVTFHQTDPTLLLSASQDSTLKLFDLREKSSCVSTFSSTESVRDVKFNPFNCNTFASVSENGTVQLWDIRRAEKFTQQFTAHSGPIYCLDYHPTQQWLATGSRDKLIKVWSMTSQKPSLEYTIHTIAVVGRVRWRPERKFHIASCSLVVDYSIYIWDVRRPFIPYASFNEHTNVTTDICFKGIPEVLLSTSKDSTIYKHATIDAQHPAASSNPQSGSINYRGDLLFVCKTKAKPAVPITMPNSGSATKLNIFKKPTVDTVDSAADSFHLAKSSLHYFTMESNEQALETIRMDDALTKTLKKDFMFFRGCAIEYKLKTDQQLDFLAMLEHNGNVAKRHGRANVAMLWNLVKMIYKTAPLKRNHVNHLTSQTSNQSSSALSGITRASGSFGTSGLGMMASNASNNNIHLDGSGDHAAQNLFGGSSNDDLIEPIELNGGILIPKVSVSDLEVEVCDESMNYNRIDSHHLRNGFLYTGPHDNVIKELPACSSSVINHDLTHAHYKNHRNEIVREVETSPVSAIR